jgi:hypothetical protein
LDVDGSELHSFGLELYGDAVTETAHITLSSATFEEFEKALGAVHRFVDRELDDEEHYVLVTPLGHRLRFLREVSNNKG